MQAACWPGFFAMFRRTKRSASIDTRSNMSLASNPAFQLQEETFLSSTTGLGNAEKVVKIAAVVQPSQSMLLNPVFLASAILRKVVASTAVDRRLRLVNASREVETAYFNAVWILAFLFAEKRQIEVGL